MPDDDRRTLRFLYIHGFNSSPASAKAQIFTAWCHRHVPGVRIELPELSYDPAVAMAQLEGIMREPGGVQLIVGSSLGGYYATWLSQAYDVPTALINPAVAPHRNLSSDFLGPQKNYYSGKEYTLTLKHVNSLMAFECQRIEHPERIFLLVQTGDEVLDYRAALSLYRDCQQRVMEGGNHSFEDIEQVLPDILQFAGFTYTP